MRVGRYQVPNSEPFGLSCAARHTVHEETEIQHQRSISCSGLRAPATHTLESSLGFVHAKYLHFCPESGQIGIFQVFGGPKKQEWGGGGGGFAMKDSEVKLLQEQVDKLRRQVLKNYEVAALREEIIAQLQVSFASFCRSIFLLL